MKIFSILLLLPLFITACSGSDTATSNSGNDIPLGELKGKIILYDSLGKIMSDASGAIVKLEGTSFSATTDANGIWSIKDLPSRTYSISFIKPGFDTMKNTSYQFLGGGITYYGEINLQQELKFTGTLDGFVFQPGTNQAIIYYDYSPDAPDSVLIEGHLYLSRTAAIEPLDKNSYQLNVLVYSYFDTPLHSNNQSFSGNDFVNFKPGDTIYAKLFFGIHASLDQYIDVSTLRTTLVGYGTPSNTLSAVMP